MSNGGLRTVVAALAAAAIGVVLPGPAQAAPGDPTAGYAGGGAVSPRFPTALLAAPGVTSTRPPGTSTATGSCWHG